MKVAKLNTTNNFTIYCPNAYENSVLLKYNDILGKTVIPKQTIAMELTSIGFNFSSSSSSTSTFQIHIFINTMSTNATFYLIHIHIPAVKHRAHVPYLIKIQQ